MRDLKSINNESSTNLLQNTSRRSRRRRSSLNNNNNNNNNHFNSNLTSSQCADNRARKIPIIRETRSSRMRKSALVVDVMRQERNRIRQETSKLKNDTSGVRRPPTAANLSSVTKKKSERKQRSIKNDKQKFGNYRGGSFNANHNNSVFELSHNSVSNSHYLDQSFELVNSGAGSPRVNVHPDEFITGQSFNRYQRHRSPEKSLDDQAWRTLLSRYNEFLNVFFFQQLD